MTPQSFQHVARPRVFRCSNSYLTLAVFSSFWCAITVSIKSAHVFRQSWNRFGLSNSSLWNLKTKTERGHRTTPLAGKWQLLSSWYWWEPVWRLCPVWGFPVQDVKRMFWSEPSRCHQADQGLKQLSLFSLVKSGTWGHTVMSADT